MSLNMVRSMRCWVSIGHLWVSSQSHKETHFKKMYTVWNNVTNVLKFHLVNFRVLLFWSWSNPVWSLCCFAYFSYTNYTACRLCDCQANPFQVSTKILFLFFAEGSQVDWVSRSSSSRSEFESTTRVSFDVKCTFTSSPSPSFPLSVAFHFFS